MVVNEQLPYTSEYFQCSWQLLISKDEKEVFGSITEIKVIFFSILSLNISCSGREVFLLPLVNDPAENAGTEGGWVGD
jgi:hypothetical protein